jgi:hypothetical protein
MQRIVDPGCHKYSYVFLVRKRHLCRGRQSGDVKKFFTKAAACNHPAFGNVVRLGLVIAAMMRFFLAVLEQIAMQLLDVIFSERDLFPGLENQLHRFGATGYFLLVSRCERFDLQVGEQPLHFAVGEFAAFNASR